MNTSRRAFGEQMLIFMLANILIACESPSRLTSPSSPPATPPGSQPSSSTLIARVQQLPDFSTAQRVSYGSNGAARIAIRGDINWNFFVNDAAVAIGSIVSPSIDVSTIDVPNASAVAVRNI